MSSGLSATHYIILLLIYKKEYQAAQSVVNSLFGVEDTYLGEVYTRLEADGWIKITGPTLPQDIEIRQRFINCLGADVTPVSTDVDSWIDDYRMLFKNTKTGAMGDRMGVLDRMKRFTASNPSYTKEDILKATSMYVQSQAPTYRYLQRADYFIGKRDESGIWSSKLAGILEEISSPEWKDDGFSRVI